MERAVRTRWVEHASERGASRFALRLPEPRLARHVTGFNAYSEHGTGPCRRREVPSGLATLVVNLGADLGVSFPGEDSRVFAAGGAFFSGPGQRYAVTETEDSQEGAQVMLTALGARRLLGIPLEEVGDATIDLADLFGQAADELIGRLSEANSYERRLSLLEDAVRGHLADSTPIAGDLVHAHERLRDSHGLVSVQAPAQEIGCSRKHLSGRFHREFGMPPKLFARTLRFARAVRTLKADRVTSWAALAAECGYADQAHLSRDFSAFAGAPPSQFAARRMPDEGGFRD